MDAQLLITPLILIGVTILILRLFPPKNLLNDRVAIPEIIFSAILLFSFFLTWFNWEISSLSLLSVRGYEIPIKIQQSLEIEDFITKSDKTVLYVSYLVYLIPIFSVATIISSSLKQNKTANITARFASLIPFLCSLILSIFFIAYSSIAYSSKEGESAFLNIFNLFDFGFYLMILSGMGLWVSALRTSNLVKTSQQRPFQETLLKKKNTWFEGRSNTEIWFEILAIFVILFIVIILVGLIFGNALSQLITTI